MEPAGRTRWGRATILGAAAALLMLLVAAVPSQALLKPEQAVRVTEVRVEPPLEPGQTSTLTVTAEIPAGWHINSDQPLDPAYIPTLLTLDLPPGVEAGPVTYPFAEEITPGFSGGEKLAVFTGTVAMHAALKASAAYQSGLSQPLGIKLDYQACNEVQCLRPASISLTTYLPAASPGDGRAVSSPGAASRRTSADGVLEAAPAQVFRRHGLVLGLLVVFLSGVALNLTPCVYPLIGVTIAYFGTQSTATPIVLGLAVAYVLGIATAFSTMGVVAAFSGGLLGATLQSPVVLTAIALVLLALAAASFGFFEIRPPNWLMQRFGTARPGYLGALGMGLGMGVVAAPCIGPFVLGLLLLVEKSQSALLGFGLFFTLAIGLGLPYVALALAAGHIGRLPRSGRWLAWVEQLFGFVLVGLAIYFLDPVVPSHLMSRLLPIYAAAAGIFLGFLSPAGRTWRPFARFKLALGVLSAFALIYVLFPQRYQQLTFEPFSRELLERARLQHKPVILDFSADWCLPCREMDRSTFRNPAVVKAASRFVRLKADLTQDSGSNEKVTAKFDVRGVPTTMFFDWRGKVRGKVVGYIGPREFLRDLGAVD